jgi:hypothetical protein
MYLQHVEDRHLPRRNDFRHACIDAGRRIARRQGLPDMAGDPLGNIRCLADIDRRAGQDAVGIPSRGSRII